MHSWESGGIKPVARHGIGNARQHRKFLYVQSLIGITLIAAPGDRIMVELGTAPSVRDLQHFVSSLTEADIRSAPLNVHKQVANRVIEPFMWHTVIVTATDWSNSFALRTHASAQPEIRGIATLMRAAMIASRPVAVDAGGLAPATRPRERARGCCA